MERSERSVGEMLSVTDDPLLTEVKEHRGAEPGPRLPILVPWLRPAGTGCTLLPARHRFRVTKELAAYEFKCKDIGMKCGFEVKGASSRDEVLQLASVHAKVTHNMQTIPPDVAQKVSSAIKG